MKISTDIYYVLFEFLKASEIKNLIKSNKSLYNNDKIKIYAKKIILERCRDILIKFWRKYIYIGKIYNYQFNNEYKLTKKIIAFQFFKYYDKEFINLWYNNQVNWKKKIIDKYKTKHTYSPTRLDLFNLILKMPVNESITIGW